MYRKNLEPMCEYCQHSNKSADPLLFLCKKKGLVSFDHHCRRFQYDPIKRVPKPAPTLNTNFSPDDFKID